MDVFSSSNIADLQFSITDLLTVDSSELFHLDIAVCDSTQKSKCLSCVIIADLCFVCASCRKCFVRLKLLLIAVSVPPN